jgi:hypothetical protein
VPDEDGETLHICVRVITENGHPHPFKTVAPEHAKVNWILMDNNNERNCLQCDKDSFDPVTESVFLPITAAERKNHRKM